MPLDTRAETYFSAHRTDAVRLAYLLTRDREAAEDIAQDAFIRVFRRLGDLRQPQSFVAYLRRTVVNLAKDHHRKGGRERNAVAAVGRLQSRLTDDELSQEQESLLEAAARLPRRQFVALVLRYCEGLSEAETADVLQSSIPAVKSLTNRGLATLRHSIGGFDER